MNPVFTGYIRVLAFAAALLLQPFLALADWQQSLRKGDIVYFLPEASPKIERYSLVTQQWLAPIALPTQHGTPTAFGLDDDGLYVAYGSAVKRYTVNGGLEIHILNANSPITEIFSDGNLLLLNRSDYMYARVTSINKVNNVVIDEFENYIDALAGASIAPGINKIFGRSSGVSPSDITYASYNSDGMFLLGGDSPHHGDYPGASRTWVFPDEAKVVDDSGTVYSTGDLHYLNSFAGRIDDLAFLGTDVPIVLRDGRLIAYSNALLPTGSHALSFTAKSIEVFGTNVVVFWNDVTSSNGIGVTLVPLALLNPPKPGQPVNPEGLSFTADEMFLDRNNILYLFSASHQSLFRWSVEDQRYLATIPLLGAPTFVGYSASNHAVYLAYPGGLIRTIDLTAPELSELPFANLPSSPMGLATAGAYVFAGDGSGAWMSHYTFAPNGAMISSKDWNYYSKEYIWSEANQKMYFFRDDTSPNDLHAEQINANGIAYPGLAPGALGSSSESPLHDSAGFTHPIRISPDGLIVVLGSGKIHNGSTLARLSSGLANTITDAAWLGGGLKTIRNINSVAQLQEWTGPAYGLGTVRQLPGTAQRLFSVRATNLLATCMQDGRPSFYVLDSSFNIVAPDDLAAPPGLVVSAVSANSVTLQWSDVAGEEGYVIERSQSVGGAWTKVGKTGLSVASFADPTVASGNEYFYRVTATNVTQQSSPSEAVSVLVMPPATPTNVIASATSATTIRLTWERVPFATGYRVERSAVNTNSWSLVTTLDGAIEQFVNSSLTPNTDYYYRVRATNGVGASSFSSVATTTTPQVPASVPSIYSIYAGAFSVYLSWSDSGYEDGCVIERMIFGGSWITVTNVGRNQNSYTDNSVVPSTTYLYRMYATNSLGSSGVGLPQSVTTLEMPVPAVPSALSASPTGSSMIRVMWSDTLYETSYRLERRTENLTSWELVAVLPADTVAYTDTNVLQGIQYWYRVQAANATGLSGYSAQDDATAAVVVELFADDFDPEKTADGWPEIAGGVVTNGGRGFDSSNALFFSLAGIRSATTAPLIIGNESSVTFKLRAGNEALDGELWNNSEAGESILLEYSRNRGATWTTIQTIQTTYPQLSKWTTLTIAVPFGAIGLETQFRWRQATHSGIGMDTWAIDDVSIVGPAPQAPGVVPFLIGSPSSSTSIALYWAGAERATSYLVERRSASQPFTTVATVPAAMTFYTDTGVAPHSAYTYRIRATNSGGFGGYSPLATTFTWSDLQQWLAENYGTPDALTPEEMQSSSPDGTIPLLRYAFNMSVDDIPSTIAEGGASGFPRIWFDAEREALTVELVCRKAALDPEVRYEVQFSTDLVTWAPAGSAILVESIDAGLERVRWVDDAPADNRPVRFCRVVVSHVPLPVPVR